MAAVVILSASDGASILDQLESREVNLQHSVDVTERGRVPREVRAMYLEQLVEVRRLIAVMREALA